MHYTDGWWSPDTLRNPTKLLPGAQVIAQALGYWTGPRRYVIQAGAHIGIWPRALAQHFSHVLCFEPEHANWACLQKNIGDDGRIVAYQCALAARPGAGALVVHPQGSGRHRLAAKEESQTIAVYCWAIDSLAVPAVDAIFLDVEGAERYVLQGAAHTLGRDRPLLVCEENACAADYGLQPGSLTEWLLTTYQYVQVATYQDDIIFLPQERVVCP